MVPDAAAAQGCAMTTTPPDAPSGPGPGPADDHGPRATRDEVRDLGRLRRSTTDRKVAGVAGGLARHLDIDPVILRVAFVVLVFFGGAGILVYGACWLLVPEDDRANAPFGLDERSRGVALVVVGVVAVLAVIGDSWGMFGFPWQLAVIALIALFLLTRSRSSRSPAPSGPPAGSPAPSDPGGYPAASPTASPAPDAPSAWSYSAPPAPPATSYRPVAEPAPRSPRRRGPILFWFTLALIALAEGVVGIVDLAGVSVAASVYPAVAVTIVGAMLLVGAFYGRAGGLILIGLIATLMLAGTTAAGRWEGKKVEATPAAAAAVEDRYDVQTGEVVLDLTDVRDLQALDGRTVTVSVDVGQIEVRVPAGITVRAHADIDGPGNIELFGNEHGGIDTVDSAVHRGGAGAPVLRLDTDLSVGQITVTATR